ncbi:MAG TPA: response regulator [Phycisphaerae bacterium]|nr:response regulator [Phycisphaerae bacterium]HUU23855.1 response regulator [Phycisphaerae bacterium]
MASLRHKSVFTTGEAADICGLSQQTIIRCFDNGQLGGFRVPGSKFRRIPRAALIKFMQQHDIPLNVLESTRIKVLVVDDDPAIVEMLVDGMTADGRFEIRTAATGFEAGVEANRFRPDLLVLDYMLPDINGNVVCRTIRQSEELSQTRILIISGVINQPEIDQLLGAGADDFIRKPFRIDQVIERIVELVQGRTR